MGLCSCREAQRKKAWRLANAIDPRGDLYTDDNVKQRLATRNLMDELRSSGEILGGPSSFTQKDVQAFANQLDRFLTKHWEQS